MDTLKDLGVLFLTGFVGGMAAAAGKHFYNSTATKLGGQPGVNVAPLKRVV
jgi:energy-converting hydrogenase Eha subunit G